MKTLKSFAISNTANSSIDFVETAIGTYFLRQINIKPKGDHTTDVDMHLIHLCKETALDMARQIIEALG